MLSVFSQRVHAQRLIDFVHLLCKEHLIIGRDFLLCLIRLHLPNFQNRVLAPSSQELAIRAEFSDPYAIIMRLETLNQVPVEILSALFVELRWVLFVLPPVDSHVLHFPHVNLYVLLVPNFHLLSFHIWISADVVLHL